MWGTKQLVGLEGVTHSISAPGPIIGSSAMPRHSARGKRGHSLGCLRLVTKDLVTRLQHSLCAENGCRPLSISPLSDAPWGVQTVHRDTQDLSSGVVLPGPFCLIVTPLFCHLTFLRSLILDRYCLARHCARYTVEIVYGCLVRTQPDRAPT